MGFVRARRNLKPTGAATCMRSVESRKRRLEFLAGVGLKQLY